MRIKKIKLKEEFIYPATIANAVKDCNFKKEDNSIMNQCEINALLNSKLSVIDSIKAQVEALTNPDKMISKDDIYMEDNILTFKNLKVIN